MAPTRCSRLGFRQRYDCAIKDAYAVHMINVDRRIAAIDTTACAAALGGPDALRRWLIKNHDGLSDRHKAGAVVPGKSSHLGIVTVQFPTGG
jgi:hypothetical protein